MSCCLSSDQTNKGPKQQIRLDGVKLNWRPWLNWVTERVLWHKKKKLIYRIHDGGWGEERNICLCSSIIYLIIRANILTVSKIKIKLLIDKDSPGMQPKERASSFLRGAQQVRRRGWVESWVQERNCFLSQPHNFRFNLNPQTWNTLMSYRTTLSSTVIQYYLPSVFWTMGLSCTRRLNFV